MMTQILNFLKPKRQLNLIIAAMFMALQMPLFLLTAPTASVAPADKVFVCKYTGTPGVNEALQTGDNPISVSSNSIPNYQGPGSYFADEQGRSYVLMVDNTAPGPAGDPNVSACPAPAPTIIAVPVVPVIDPCGLANAVYGTVPAGNYSFVLNGNGSITLNANPGFLFTGGLASVTLPAPIDSGLLCLPTTTVIQLPATPSVTDPCGLSNATWDVPTDTTTLNWELLQNGHLTVTILAANTIFPGGATTHDFGTALDSGVLCPVPANPSAVASAEECSDDTVDTGEVKVTVTNTDDATNAAVTYTVVLGGQTMTITNLADGEDEDVTFTGLAAGNYTATVTGSDTTSTTSNEVTVTECQDRVTLCHATGSGTNPYVKITISAAGAFHGHLDDGSGGIHGDHQNGEDIIPPFEYKGQSYSQNWDTEGQLIFRNNCEIPEEPANPAGVATLIPCVPDSGLNDIVIVTVTNTDDDTDDTVTYTVTLGGQTKTITLADGLAGSVSFSGVAVGTVSATITGDDDTSVVTNTVTVTNCEDEGDILGEVILTGGQGGGAPAPVVLAETGMGTERNITGSIFAAFMIIGLTGALAVSSRRARLS